MTREKVDEAARTLKLSPDVDAFLLHLKQANVAADANVEDLLLAWSCLRKDRTALGELERRLLRVATPVLLRYQSVSAEEVLQHVREKLLLGPKPGLKSYTGRGALVVYLKAVTTTTAIDVARKSKMGDAGEDDDQLAQMASAENGPESRIIRKDHEAAFAQAFKRALTGLVADERTLLRMKFVDQLSDDAIARAFQVHRTTALRWIDKVKKDLVVKTREEFRTALSLREEEAEEVLKQMHLTLADRLSRVLPAIKG